MHILIYGGGAVGLGIASCLIHSGSDVDIVARPETVAALRADGLVRTGLFGSVRAEPHAFASHACLDEIGHTRYDFVLICTKSFDSEAAAKDLAEHADRIGSDATLVLFQNGWGNAEIVCTHFDKDRVYNARVITGFHRHRANEVDVTVHAGPEPSLSPG